MVDFLELIKLFNPSTKARFYDKSGCFIRECEFKDLKPKEYPKKVIRVIILKHSRTADIELFTY